MIKTKVVYSYGSAGLDTHLNLNLEELQQRNCEIVDIKFGIFDATRNVFFSALIIYKEQIV